MHGHYYLVYLAFLEQTKGRIQPEQHFYSFSKLSNTDFLWQQNLQTLQKQADPFPCPLPGSCQLLDSVIDQRNPSGISSSRSQQQTLCTFEQISNGQPEAEICILQENKVLWTAVSLRFRLSAVFPPSFLSAWHVALASVTACVNAANVNTTACSANCPSVKPV